MRRFGIGISALCIVVFGVLVDSKLDHSRYDPAAPYEEKIAHWEGRIQTVGGKRAYEEMVAAQKGSVIGAEHVEAHIFGTALYRSEGIKGVTVCDDRFSYACFHQFIGEALADLGTESLDKIVEVCIGIPGCRHGIGHGVLGYFGYSPDGLEKAISICATLPREVNVQGCYGGVFMEYNVRSLLGVNQERPLGTNWFGVCEQVPKSARRVCYLWQPTWWGRNLKSDDQNLTPSALKTMGTKCDEIANKELKAVCFEGIGVSALNTGKTLNDGVSACSFVSADMRDQALCETSVARYIALVQGLEPARSICRGLTGVYQEGCMSDVANARPEKSYIGEMLSIEKDI